MIESNSLIFQRINSSYYCQERTRSTQLNKEQKNFTPMNHADLAFLCRGVNLRFIDWFSHHTHTLYPLVSLHMRLRDHDVWWCGNCRLIVPDLSFYFFCAVAGSSVSSDDRWPTRYIIVTNILWRHEVCNKSTTVVKPSIVDDTIIARCKQVAVCITEDHRSVVLLDGIRYSS